MPAIGPIKRKDLIAYLRALGFEPPVWGGDHQYMRGRGIRFGYQIRTAKTSAVATEAHSDGSWDRAAGMGVSPMSNLRRSGHMPVAAGD